MSNLRKVNRILFFTLLVFSLFTFANYSESSSKYVIQYENPDLTYNIGFKPLYDNFVPSVKAIGEKVEYVLEFYRTAVIGDKSVKKDVLNVNLNLEDSDCEIVSINGFKTNGGKNSYKIDGQNAILTYKDITSNIDSKSNVSIVYSCTASTVLEKHNGVDSTKFAYEILEEIDDVESFKYAGGTYYNKYVKPAGYIISDDKRTLKITHATLIDSYADVLTDWIDQYVSKYFDYLNKSDANSNLRNYLQHIFDADVDLSQIKGISYDSVTKEYTLDDRVMSYAYTVVNSSNPKLLYFLSLNNEAKFDASTVEEMFDYYFLEYYSEYIDSKDEIYKYIEDNKGIYAAFTGSVKIPGINVITNTAISISASILSIIHPVPPDLTIGDITNSTAGEIKNLLNTNLLKFLDGKVEVDEANFTQITSNMLLTNDIGDFIHKDVNNYYYLSVGDQVVSIRIYNQDDGNYYAHFELVDESNLVEEANKHEYSYVSTEFKKAPEGSGLTALQSAKNVIENIYPDIIKVINLMDKTYNTDFASVVTKDVVLEFIAKYYSSTTSVESEITENKLNGIIKLKYSSSRSSGTFSVEFDPSSVVIDPPANEEAEEENTTPSVPNQTPSEDLESENDEALKPETTDEEESSETKKDSNEEPTSTDVSPKTEVQGVVGESTQSQNSQPAKKPGTIDDPDDEADSEESE